MIMAGVNYAFTTTMMVLVLWRMDADCKRRKQALYTVLIVTLNAIARGGGSNLYPPELEGTFTPEIIQMRKNGSKVVLVSEQAMLNLIYVLKSCMLLMVRMMMSAIYIHIHTKKQKKKRKDSNPSAVWSPETNTLVFLLLSSLRASPSVSSTTSASSTTSPSTSPPAGSPAKSPFSPPAARSTATGRCRRPTRSARRSSTMPLSRAASTSAPTC